MKVRSQRARHRRRETSNAQILDEIPENQTMHGDPAAHASLRELGSILDEELQRLPAGCRDAVVLCLLEGLSHTEAAQQLGWPLGTLKTRLNRGRERLQKRLHRRGVGLSAVTLSVVLADRATAMVPVAVLRATQQYGGEMAVSAKVAALANAGSRMLGTWKLALLLLVGLSAGGICFAVANSSFWDTGPGEPSIVSKLRTAESVAGKKDDGDPLPAGALARMGSIRWRHAGEVQFVEFLPDGQKVVSAAKDRFVRIWEFPTGKPLRRFGPGPRPEHKREAMPGGFKQELDRPVPDIVAVARDGRLIATRFEQETVEILEAATGKKLASHSFQDSLDAVALAFAPDGKCLAILGWNGTIRLWDFAADHVRELQMAEKMPGYAFSEYWTAALHCSPDSKILAAVLKRQVNFWDAETGKQISAVKPPADKAVLDIASPVCSPNSKVFAFSRDLARIVDKLVIHYPATREVCFLHPITGKFLQQLSVGDLTSLAFSPDGTKLYSKSGDPSSFQEWDVQVGKVVRQLTPHLATAKWKWRRKGLTISPDGKTLATFSGMNTIPFIDLASREDTAVTPGHSDPLTSLSFTLADKRLITISRLDSTLQIWEASTGKHLKQFALAEKPIRMSAADGSYLMAESTAGKAGFPGLAIKKKIGSEILTVRAFDGNFMEGKKDDGQEVSPEFFTPDGQTLLCRTDSGTRLVLVDVASGKERCRVTISAPISTWRGPSITPFFSPDGRFLAIYEFLATRSIAVHDAVTGKAMQKFSPGQHAVMRGGAFSVDGRTIALDSGEGTVALIELASGKLRRTFGKPRTRLSPGDGSYYMTDLNPQWSGEPGSSTIAFAPDGRLLAHAGPDNVLEIWDVEAGTSLARFAGHRGAITGVAFGPMAVAWPLPVRIPRPWFGRLITFAPSYVPCRVRSITKLSRQIGRLSWPMTQRQPPKRMTPWPARRHKRRRFSRRFCGPLTLWWSASWSSNSTAANSRPVKRPRLSC